jgi:hypothetical protein
MLRQVKRKARQLIIDDDPGPSAAHYSAVRRDNVLDERYCPMPEARTQT